MSNRSVELEHIELVADKPLENEIYQLIVGVDYRMGGPNMWSGQVAKRGYYISATPTVVGIGPKAGSRSFIAWSGVCQCVQEAKKFSAKELDAVVKAVKTRPEYEQLKQHVITKNKLVVKEPVDAASRL